jgi:pilus assembly protein CpaB
MRAISVRVESIIGDADSVLPGTSVDIIRKDMPPNGSEEEDSRIILENIQVLTVGQNVIQSIDDKPQNANVVTLLVTPEQAQKLTLAKSDGIQLAVRK